MPKFLSDSLVYIIDADVAKQNIGKRVRLIKWVHPGEEYSTPGMIFEGGETGAWVVQGELGQSLMRRNPDDTLEPATVCACKPEHLSATLPLNLPGAPKIWKRTKSA